MERTPNALDRELDEALEMTFPASDPVAVAEIVPAEDETADTSSDDRAAKPET
jgi:hypothetical protein